MNRFLVAVVVVSVLMLSGSGAYAHSDALSLNFNRLGNLQPIGDLYSGYGVTFSSNVFGLRSCQNVGNGVFSQDLTGSSAIFVMGAKGTGAVLGGIALTANNGNCSSPTYRNRSSIGVNFSGTAESVTVAGPADGIGISDITDGASSIAVPEPSTIYLLGAGLVAISLNQLRRIWKR